MFARELGARAAETKGNNFGKKASNTVFVKTLFSVSDEWVTMNHDIGPWKAVSESVVNALSRLGINPPILPMVNGKFLVCGSSRKFVLGVRFYRPVPR